MNVIPAGEEESPGLFSHYPDHNGPQKRNICQRERDKTILHFFSYINWRTESANGYNKIITGYNIV